MSEKEDMEPEGAHTTEKKFQIFLNASFLGIVKSAHHFSHISYMVILLISMQHSALPYIDIFSKVLLLRSE